MFPLFQVTTTLLVAAINLYLSLIQYNVGAHNMWQPCCSSRVSNGRDRKLL